MSHKPCSAMLGVGLVLLSAGFPAPIRADSYWVRADHACLQREVCLPIAGNCDASFGDCQNKTCPVECVPVVALVCVYSPGQNCKEYIGKDTCGYDAPVRMCDYEEGTQACYCTDEVIGVGRCPAVPTCFR